LTESCIWKSIKNCSDCRINTVTQNTILDPIDIALTFNILLGYHAVCSYITRDSMAVMTYINAIGMKAIISKSNPYLNGIGMLIDS